MQSRDKGCTTLKLSWFISSCFFFLSLTEFFPQLANNRVFIVLFGHNDEKKFAISYAVFSGLYRVSSFAIAYNMMTQTFILEPHSSSYELLWLR